MEQLKLLVTKYPETNFVFWFRDGGFGCQSNTKHDGGYICEMAKGDTLEEVLTKMTANMTAQKSRHTKGELEQITTLPLKKEIIKKEEKPNGNALF